MIASVEILGLERLNVGLDRIERGITHLRPFWKLCGKEFRGQEGKLFERAPWKPLKRETEIRKAKKHGGPSRILVATGRLLRSLTVEGHADAVERISDDEAEFGTAVPYSVFHEKTRNPVGEPDEDRYNTLAGEYVGRVAREAGFS